MLEPANTIIALCGGAKAVAEMTGRDPKRVYRWAYPRDRGGTDGRIPSDVQQLLLERAQARGIDLRPEHFFFAPAATQKGAA